MFDLLVLVFLLTESFLNFFAASSEGHLCDTSCISSRFWHSHEPQLPVYSIFFLASSNYTEPPSMIGPPLGCKDPVFLLVACLLQ